MPCSRRCAVVLLVLLLPGIASAHSGHAAAGGFTTGFLHPLGGIDHMVAMVAVGIWGAILGSPLLIVLPVIFPLMMAAGALLGIAGIPVPFVEIGIASSAVVLGAAVFTGLRPAIWVAILIVGVFAIFHGHAHGTELSDTTTPAEFIAGFVLSTGLLHLVGVGLGAVFQSVKHPRLLERAGGAIITCTGLAVLWGAVA